MHSFKSLIYFGLIFLLMATLILPTRSLAHTSTEFMVNTTLDSHDADPGNGTCADSSGNCSIRAAIEESNALIGTNSISLPAATYLLDGEVQITDSLTIDGTEKTTTIISGQNANRVFLVDLSGGINRIQVHINRITIENGTVSGNGGGIWNDEVLFINDSFIKNNTASENGGGIYNSNGNLALIDSFVISNSVTNASYLGGGGGIYNTGGDVVLTNTSVISNTGASSFVFGGGGIHNSYGRMTIVSSDIRNNSVTVDNVSASAEGGGIYSLHGNLSLFYSSVNGNLALGPGFAEGGGLFIFEGEALLDQSTINGNNAVIGGGISNLHGRLSIYDSSIHANSSVRGGGIDNAGTDASITIRNSSIVSNSVTEQGGGIYHFYGVISLTESTVANNSANVFGSGFLVHTWATLTVTNSTISGNSLFTLGVVGISHSTITDEAEEGIHVESGSTYLKNTILDTNCGGNITSLGHNLVSNAGGCTLTPTTGDIVDQNPDLGPLDNYGGNTNTHALLPESPAIDKGICTDSNGDLIPTDQRGASRSGSCDIGAYEYGGTITVLVSSPNPSLPGETVVFTATVTKGEAETLSGDVVLYDEGALLGTSSLNDMAQAIFAISDLPLGSHNITATYQGDIHYAASSAEIYTQMVITRLFLPVTMR